MVTTPELVSSWADSFSGSLDANGLTMTIAPFALVSGFAPPPYDDITMAWFFSRKTVRSEPPVCRTLCLS